MKKGFTIMEVIVAVGLFSIAALLSVGSIFMLHQAQKKAINIQNANDNVRFALEAIAREIRTGHSYSTNCAWPAGCSNFTFRNAANDIITYRLQNNIVERSKNAGPFLPVTDPQRTITSLRFYVAGSFFTEQQRVTIGMKIDAATSPLQTIEASQFILQTTVSKRQLF